VAPSVRFLLKENGADVGVATADGVFTPSVPNSGQIVGRGTSGFFVSLNSTYDLGCAIGAANDMAGKSASCSFAWTCH
jgi:hypothetical protein